MYLVVKQSVLNCSDFENLSINLFQTSDLPDYLLPKITMVFDNFEAARIFYNRYARHAGFGTRIGQHNRNDRYLYCNRQGTYTSRVDETDRQRENTTKRCGCKAGMKLKDYPDGTCVIKNIRFEHNHKLILSPSMLNFLHSHKRFDKSLLQYVKFLQFHNVPHRTILSMLYSSVGGGQYLGFHGRDLLNQYVTFNSKTCLNIPFSHL